MNNLISERLKELRIEHKLTTQQLSKALSVSSATISRWENGLMIPGADEIYRMAVYFKVSADFLLGLSDC